MRGDKQPFAWIGSGPDNSHSRQTSAWTSTHFSCSVQHSTQVSDGVPYNREDGCFVDRAQYLMAVTHYSGARHDTSRGAVSSYCHCVTTTCLGAAWESSGSRNSKFNRKNEIRICFIPKLAKKTVRWSRGGVQRTVRRTEVGKGVNDKKQGLAWIR